MFNDYLLNQAYSRDIFKQIVKEEVYSHKTKKEVTMTQYDPKTDEMNDVESTVNCYINIVQKLVKYSTDQMKAIKINQHSKVNILNQRIRDLELRYSTLSHSEKVDLHEL